MSHPTIPGWLKGSRRFDPGTITITSAAHEILRAARVSAESLIAQHAAGNWGELSPADQQTCEGNLLTGGHVMSLFTLSRFPLGLGKDNIWLCSLVRDRWCYVCIESELSGVL